MAHFVYNILLGPDGYEAIPMYPYCDTTSKLKGAEYQWGIICISEDN